MIGENVFLKTASLRSALISYVLVEVNPQCNFQPSSDTPCLTASVEGANGVSNDDFREPLHVFTNVAIESLEEYLSRIDILANSALPPPLGWKK